MVTGVDRCQAPKAIVATRKRYLNTTRARRARDQGHRGKNPYDPLVERVAVIMAMEAEAAPLRAALGAVAIDGPSWAAALPVRLALAPAAGARPEVLVAVNGIDPATGVDCIGSTAAALSTQVALSTGGVDLVVTAGTAGGWQRADAAIGDVYVAWPHIACHDRRIDLPGFDQFGRAEIPTADLRRLAAELGCRLGIVTTGDSLDESPTDRERIVANGAEVKEMEAAAVAWVAQLHSTPVTAVKAITDLVDSPVPTATQFRANLAAAAESLQATMVDLIDRLGDQ